MFAPSSNPDHYLMMTDPEAWVKSQTQKQNNNMEAYTPEEKLADLKRNPADQQNLNKAVKVSSIVYSLCLIGFVAFGYYTKQRWYFYLLMAIIMCPAFAALGFNLTRRTDLKEY